MEGLAGKQEWVGAVVQTLLVQVEVAVVAWTSGLVALPSGE